MDKKLTEAERKVILEQQDQQQQQQSDSYAKDIAEGAMEGLIQEKIDPKTLVVCVTGVAGFIGSHVAKRCLELGMTVIGIDNLSGGFEDQVPKGVVFYNNDCRDKQTMNYIFSKYEFHTVFCLHAYAAENLSHFVRKFNYENNLISTVNLINASVNNNVKLFVFTSSIAVYGDRIPPFSEDEPVTPKDPYAISKWACEVDIRAALDMFGLNHIIFRPGNVYGPHQNLGDKYRNVIGIFMNQIMQGQPLTVFGDGTQTRAFSYIDDVAPHIAESILRPQLYNHTFNIGGSQHYSINELVEVIAREFETVPQVKYLEARQETHQAYSDQTKSTQAFGRAQWHLREGVKAMADWARQAGARKSGEFENIEIRKNLPEGW